MTARKVRASVILEIEPDRAEQIRAILDRPDGVGGPSPPR
ncbi:hypothetical protein FHU36_003350 [Nonomuraea muscovyensis]|uniref:Uncharacterized protein n=1 Tax=Nonomuraea muscovyensis TaxID=1124761 RepID=A0A7X0EZK2_9ACTN|nr:hypothetical protein [Nonomuraea muscovyensis]